MMRKNVVCRHGALAVEAAVVMPVMLLLFLMIIVGGMGVLRYQQTVMLSFEAARWASVRGQQWQQTTGQTSPTEQQIFQSVVVPMASGMNQNNISMQIYLVNQITGAVVPWDNSNKGHYSLTNANQPITNHVRVTITYLWSPGVLLGNMYMTNTCEMPMSF